ncbi:FecR family protein [Gaoshiqia sp. Z1-71]|uniref:FecR family protein n=1 Tax=Gaoshiqia hydrogeniformans TaxID=3290090 RepID=UPI003BF8538A
MDQTLKNRIRQNFQLSQAVDDPEIIDAYLHTGNEPELEEIARENWEKSSSARVELQHVLNRVHFYINTRSKNRPFKSIALLVYYRVAAFLLVPLLLAGIYLASKNFQITESYAQIGAPSGSRVHFTLPDGSTGFLNGGSSLVYPVDFKHNRNVTLSGEGYFDVAKDESHPFTVQTPHAEVKALGTKFDVSAYIEDNEVVTTLEEGSVEIMNKADHTKTLLRPGEQNRINTHSGQMVSEKVNTRFFTSWKEEMLRFDHATFSEVVKKMERWYGVKIELDPELKDKDGYTLALRTESLREMLGLLSMTTPITYEINGNKVTIRKK